MRRRTQRITFTTVAIVALALLAAEAHAGARRSRPLKTGQTTCWNSSGVVVACAGTDQDGDLRRGESRAYQDNGDGTIRDKRTALMWEKLSDDGSIHDKDTTYTWASAFAKIDDLNTRRVRRLHRLAAAERERAREHHRSRHACSRRSRPRSTPSCVRRAARCSTCSCTVSAEMIFWSSTSYVNAPAQAWLVNFFDGTAYVAPKTARTTCARSAAAPERRERAARGQRRAEDEDHSTFSPASAPAARHSSRMRKNSTEPPP